MSSLHNRGFCITFHYFIDFKTFLDSSKDYWLNKHKELEREFLELEQVQSPFQEPRRKKRKTHAKEPPSSLSEDSFARLAAKLQIEFFVKVTTGNTLNFKQIEKYLYILSLICDLRLVHVLYKD